MHHTCTTDTVDNQKKQDINDQNAAHTHSHVTEVTIQIVTLKNNRETQARHDIHTSSSYKNVANTKNKRGHP